MRKKASDAISQLSGDVIFSGGLVSNSKLPGVSGELTLSVYLAVSANGAGLGKINDPIHPLVNSHLAVLQAVRDGNQLRFKGEVILSNDEARMGRPFMISAQVHKNYTNLILHLGKEKFTGRGFVLFGDGGR